MTVLPQTPEIADDSDRDAAELADLRRRAYGPDADIADDAAARARLVELEERLRATTSAVPAESGREPESSGQVFETGGEVREPGARSEPGAARPELGVAEPEPTRPVDRPGAFGSIVRERRTWVVGGIGLVVGAAIAVGLASYPWNGPDVVLRPEEGKTVSDADFREWLRPLGIDPDSARIFESVNGYTPWVVDLVDGGSCLMLSEDIGSGLLTFACSGAGGDPTLDVLPGLWGRGAEEIVPGATIRLVSRGDTVEVWFRGPRPTTDSAQALR